jgi:hypothetical protein
VGRSHRQPRGSLPKRARRSPNSLSRPRKPWLLLAGDGGALVVLTVVLPVVLVVVMTAGGAPATAGR